MRYKYPIAFLLSPISAKLPNTVPTARHLSSLRPRRAPPQSVVCPADSTCPRSPSGEEQFYCASPQPSGERACVSLARLCDGVPDCPGAEDELAVACLFYNAVSGD